MTVDELLIYFRGCQIRCQAEQLDRRINGIPMHVATVRVDMLHLVTALEVIGYDALPWITAHYINAAGKISTPISGTWVDDIVSALKEKLSLSSDKEIKNG